MKNSFFTLAAFCGIVAVVLFVSWQEAPEVNYSFDAIVGVVGSEIAVQDAYSNIILDPAISDNNRYSTVVSLTTTGVALNGVYGAALSKDAKFLYVAQRQGKNIVKVNLETSVVELVADLSQFTPAGTGAFIVVVNSHGDLFVSDLSYRIFKIDMSQPTPVVSVFAGAGTAGNTDGNGTDAKFNTAMGMAIDEDDNLYVADRANHIIRKITPTGDVTTVVGRKGVANPQSDGFGTIDVILNNPTGICFDQDGNLIIAEAPGSNKKQIRKITLPDYEVTTLAGGNTEVNPSTPFVHNGYGLDATFDSPFGVACDSWGNIYISDQAKNVIYRYTVDTYIATIGGPVGGVISGGGADNVVGNLATFNKPSHLLYDNTRNCLWIMNWNTSTIRKMNLTGFSVTPRLPEGLELNMGTGQLSGTPSALLEKTPYILWGFGTTGIGVFDYHLSIVEQGTNIYTISTIPGANGSISGNQQVVAGSGATFTITPDQGYEIDEIKVNDIAQSAVNPFTLENIMENTTLSVSFKVIGSSSKSVLNDSDMTIYSDGNFLKISGIGDDVKVDVYNLSGISVYSGFGEGNIELDHGFYMVKAAEIGIKIVH